MSNKLNDEELNEIGNILLAITCEALKLKVSQDSKNTIRQYSENGGENYKKKRYIIYDILLSYEKS